MQLSFSGTSTIWGPKSRTHFTSKAHLGLFFQSSTYKDVDDIQFPGQVTELDTIFGH